MRQSWELRGSSWDVLLKQHLVWLRAAGPDCCVEWDTWNNCMTTWQPQECLRLSGCSACGNDSAGEVFVGPLEQAAEAQRQGLLRDHILPPGCPQHPLCQCGFQVC